MDDAIRFGIGFCEKGASYEARFTVDRQHSRVLTALWSHYKISHMEHKSETISFLADTLKEQGIFSGLEIKKNGVLEDAVNGEPAVQAFLRGRFVYAARCRDGEVLEDLHEEDVSPRILEKWRQKMTAIQSL